MTNNVYAEGEIFALTHLSSRRFNEDDSETTLSDGNSKHDRTPSEKLFQIVGKVSK